MGYQETVVRQRDFFNQNYTKPVAYRIQQLKVFRKMVTENETQFYEAIFKDFGKSEFDTFTAEISLILKDIDHAIKNIKFWSAKKRVKHNLINFPGRSFIQPEPLGVCLIIGAWNYPYQLTFSPAIAALAAGNTVVIKPSEISSHTSRVMTTLVAKYFDKKIFTSIEGGVEETTELLKVRFDKIFFTGSTPVGKIIYAAASKYLTPVTLELGGKSPAIVTAHCNLGKTVKRLVWAKFFNAGQTCIAPDYVFVHHSIKTKFVTALKKEIVRCNYSVENHNYVQIINSANLSRLAKLISAENVTFGGDINHEKRTIAPTILENVPLSHPVMQEEIFGPILPVFEFTELDNVISFVKSNEKPLSTYIFSKSKKEQSKVLHELSFGGGCINDAIMHISNPELPFGGVGSSGIGAYHGEAGFDCFSHKKSILKKYNLLELPFKYAPITKSKLLWVKRLFKIS